MTFFTDYLSDFQAASAATGIDVSVIMAQVAIETGYGGSHAFVVQNNPAGLTGADGELITYPTKAAGFSDYASPNFFGAATYDPVRQASGAIAQARALGMSPWAGDHYDEADWIAAGQPADGAWTPPNPGIDLINTINANNLTQYDGAGGAAPSAAASSGSPTAPATPIPIDQQDAQLLAGFSAINPGAQIMAPPLGLSSSEQTNQWFINGQSFDLDVSGAIVTAELDFSITQASTLTLTLLDPDHVILNSGLFSQKAVVTLSGGGGGADASFSLVAVDVGTGGVLTVTFEAFVVAALRTATGPITAAPGQMTRTAFANALITQVQGAILVGPPGSYLYGLDEGYDRPTQEQISRGTSTAPLEDSWTCLQRLAAEIGWVCFECLGAVYFGPYSWLAAQAPVMAPVEGQAGILDITGTFDIGQPSGQLEITGTADNWIANTGAAVSITTLGPLNGIWIVSEIQRQDVEEPDLTITVMQPQPSLPEPATGGAQAAVGPSNTVQSQQTTGGSSAAQDAVQFCVNQLGKPYVWGGKGPNGFDCSGLVEAAYNSVGVPVQFGPGSSGTTEMWNSAMAKVPAGISNLRPGDLVFFAGGDPPFPGHVGIVTKVDTANNDVILIDAYSSQVPLPQQIRYDHFGYVDPGGETAFAGTYFGALRPAP